MFANAGGGGNGGSSGGTESDNVEGDNNTSEIAESSGNPIANGKDEAKSDKPKNNRRVCEICVKEYAMTTNDDDGADGDLDEMLASQAERLKLRERRALQRKMERMQEEKRTTKKKGTAAESFEENADENDGDSSGNHDDEIGGERHEDMLGEHEDAKKESSSDENIVNIEDIDEEADPFLKAVGGADKLLTGEAYQKALLERDAPC